MSLNIKDKQNIVSEIHRIINSALSIIIIDFRGVNADQMTLLRKLGRERSIYIKIVRNNLLYRAVVNTTFECLKCTFVGPTLIACSMEHPASAARLLKELSNKNVNLQIKTAAFEGKLVPASKIDYLIALPTYEEAIVRLIITIKESSIGKLVRILTKISNIKRTSQA